MDQFQMRIGSQRLPGPCNDNSVRTSITQSKRSGMQAVTSYKASRVKIEFDPLTYFRGWRGLQCNLRPKDQRVGSVYRINEGFVYYIEERNREDILRSDDIEVSETMLAALTDFGKSVGLDAPLRTFLLWENSD